MQADFVIIGGGSAGSVLAARLSEDPKTTVCLIEAGGQGDSILVRTPAAAGAMLPGYGHINNWAFQTLPQPGLNGRRGFQPRGRALGGSSAINAMLYVRGHRQVYDDWAAMGCTGWGWDDVLPWFRRAEANQRGADDWHGADGPLQVSDQVSPRPITEAFVQAAESLQHRRSHDFNRGDNTGVGHYQVTQFHDPARRGERCSAAAAYLHPVMASRPNLTVLTGWRADRVLMEGDHATGVALRRGRETAELHAGREVILSAGTIGTAHLMLLSAIGPADHLRASGVTVRHDLPGVGENLQDHFVASLMFRASGTRSIASDLSLWNRPRIGLEWLLTRGGLGATSFFEVGAFFRSGPGAAYANMQHEFLPFLADFQAGRVRIDHGYQYFLSQMRPKSRGWLRLRSADPDTHPEIVFNYLDDPADAEEMLDGLAQTRDMARQAPWAAMGGTEIAPGPDVRSRTEALAWMRSIGNTEHHPVGTCRMGHDTMAVTDGEGLVRGLTGLRIVDGSILPYIPTANVNAPIIMVAEKIADRIRGRQALARETLRPTS
jgi:choline dehydrogenase-like flavoprotein